VITRSPLKRRFNLLSYAADLVVISEEIFRAPIRQKGSCSTYTTTVYLTYTLQTYKLQLQLTKTSLCYSKCMFSYAQCTLTFL